MLDAIVPMSKFHFLRRLQLSVGTINGEDPQPDPDFATTDTPGGNIVYGGGYVFVPPVADLYVLKGLSLFKPENVVSPLFQTYINVSIRKFVL